MLRTLRQRAEIVFVLVLLWKAALLVFTAQPVPANDSFFYDGAVVNCLVQGQYCNPSLVNALPISGSQVFSAYPPLYQLALLGWMAVFGTSVLAAMWLHFVLFALYAALVLAILRELRAPVGAAHFAGLFLLGITFHDRPDSLAHVFGMAAVYAAARALGSEAEARGRKLAKRWLWLAPTSVILCLCTSLQIGGIYSLLIWLALLLPCLLALRNLRVTPAQPSLPGKGAAASGSSADLLSAASPICNRQCAERNQNAGTDANPAESNSAIRQISNLRYVTEEVWARIRPVWLALAVMTLVPVVLALGVKLVWPHLWAGFQEHAQQTPSLTSWRLPDAMELLKIIRAVPGLVLVLALLPFAVLPTSRRRSWNVPADATSAARSRGGQRAFDARRLSILLSASVAAIAVLVAALFFLTANLVLIAAYLQPLVVGAFLALWTGVERSRSRLAAVNVLLGLAVLVASIRAIGLTTVGVTCARDVNRSQALSAVASELAAVPKNATVAVSAAYLYDAWPEARRLKLLHSDWLGPAVKVQPNAEVDALRAVKPARLILTQFDYYRRYVRVLAQLQSTTSAVSVRVENLARVLPPDASPRWQRVVQHVSWAPVIVMLDWAE